MPETSRPSIGHILLFLFALSIVWVAWSGHFEFLILGFGLGSVLLTLWMSARLKVIDSEGQPLNLKLLFYLPWLIKEIIVANFDVIKRILSPNLTKSTSPTWILVSSPQKTRFARVIFANSITLTPGTISVKTNDTHILVHALSQEGADSLDGEHGGEMGQRVSNLEDS